MVTDYSEIFEHDGENGVESVFEVQYTDAEGASFDVYNVVKEMLLLDLWEFVTIQVHYTTLDIVLMFQFNLLMTLLTLMIYAEMFQS